MINMRIHEILFQLTPSRRATFRGVKDLLDDGISTHALTEGDRGAYTNGITANGISTHALTEGDVPLSVTEAFGQLFQLTPSRRATLLLLGNGKPLGYFNSRPHGGRRQLYDVPKLSLRISTHALTEGDELSTLIMLTGRLFQLTPSRRATVTMDRVRVRIDISTHALTEGDKPCSNTQPFPRISTHALTEGDSDDGSLGFRQEISTHALTEGDNALVNRIGLVRVFQLTPSRRATHSDAD